MIPNRSDIQSKHEEKIEEYFICIHVKRNKTTLITNHVAVRPRILDLRMYGTRFVSTVVRLRLTRVCIHITWYIVNMRMCHS